MSKTPPSAQLDLPFIVYKIWVTSEIRSSVLMTHVQSDRVQKRLIVPETNIACSHDDTGDTYKHRPPLVLDVAQRRLVVVLPTFRHNISASCSRVKQSNEKTTQWQKTAISQVQYILLLTL
jgi:hypothetical protein